MKRLLLPLAVASLLAQESPVVLKTSTLYDGRGKTVHNTIIVVEGSKIAHIGGAVPANALTYDLAALTVTPGWIDTHAHIVNHFDNDNRLAGSDEPVSQAAWHIAESVVATLNAGFTTIQSPGAIQDKDLRDSIARGLIPGPRILTSLEPLTEASGNAAKMRELVRERKQQGADFIKLLRRRAFAKGARSPSRQNRLLTSAEKPNRWGCAPSCMRIRRNLPR
jgi:imidazolonepropionase-like amidohydrolase